MVKISPDSVIPNHVHDLGEIERVRSPMPSLGMSEADKVEIELIRSLYHSFAARAITAICFAIVEILIVVETADRVLLLTGIGSIIVSVVRLIDARRSAKRATRTDIQIGEARLLERSFAILYYALALLLGLFSARTFSLPYPPAHMLMACLLGGFATGVPLSSGLRPRIAIPSMVIAVLPAIVVALLQFKLLYAATALLLTNLLVASIVVSRGRHEHLLKEIKQKFLFATLARHDDLTKLPNRLALREWFDDRVSAVQPPCLVAVHCLDLNGFKLVNDCYGHSVGDALLTEVAKRLSRTIREGDIVARLGGDEFAAIQCGIKHAAEADRLVERLRASIKQPFQIDEHHICVSTSIGYVLSSDYREDFEHLLDLADQALYVNKHSSNGELKLQAFGTREAT